MDKNGTIKHGGSSPSRGKSDSVKYNISLSSSPLKAFCMDSLIPTYNSGIKQYFDYTKHFGKNRGGRGGLQMWKNSFWLLRPFLFLVFILGWVLDSWAFSVIIIIASHDSSFRKTRNRQRWLQQDPPCLDCHLLLFLVLRMILYTEHGWMDVWMDGWDARAYWTLALAGRGPRSGSCCGLIPAHLVFGVKGMKRETDGQTR